MDSEKYAGAKLIANILVTSSVAKIVRDVIRTNVEDETFADKAQIVIGGFAIGGLICEKVWEHTENRLDKAIAFWEGMKEETEKKQETDNKGDDVTPPYPKVH